MPGDANILETIAAANRQRVACSAAKVPQDVIERQARAAADEGEFSFPFEAALRAPGMSFICECKRASPSKGLIAQTYDPVAIAREYEAAGAAAISCLSEPRWFRGSLDDLASVASAVSIPVLRKDFIVSEYQIFEAALAGASAVLLICSILTDEQLCRYVELCHELGLSALVEAYEPEEVPRAIDAGARIIGVNNRDLRTFKVDFGRSIELRPMVGQKRVFVSESGVRTREDIVRLEAAGVDAVLIGETLMRQADKRAALDELRGAAPAGAPAAAAPSPATAAAPVVAHLSHRDVPCARKAGLRIVRGQLAGPLIKCCGMFTEQDICAVNMSKPDLCGFVVDFPRSHRSVNTEELTELVCKLDSHIPAVGVFVDRPPHEIARLVAQGLIDVIQLHGHEDEAYLLGLRTSLLANGVRSAPIIQAFRVRSEADLVRAQASTADLILLDNGQGSGKSFDWSILTGSARPQRPFLLAGGLDPENVGSAIRAVHPYGVDLSSGLETDKHKDPAKIAAAVSAVRRIASTNLN